MPRKYKSPYQRWLDSAEGDRLFADASDPESTTGLEKLALAAWNAALTHAAEACENERVNADETKASEDYAYNGAIEHCVQAIKLASEAPR